MAKVATAKKAEVVDKELVEFVDVIRVPALQVSPKTAKELVTIAKAFLDDLNRRDEEAAGIVEKWKNDPVVTNLIDAKTGIAMITTQEDANTAAETANQIAEAVKKIEESTEKETSFFNRFHKTLTGRRGKHKTALEGLINKLKGGCRLFMLKQQQEAARKAAEAQAAIDRQYAEAKLPPAAAPVIAPEPPKIQGMSARKEWGYRIPDKLAFIKAMARGKVPLDAVSFNDAWLKAEVKLHHDGAEKGEDGKLYLFEGTVECFEDIQMARR